MKIESYKILGQNVFDEVTTPRHFFDLKEKNAVGIFHSYYGQWSGRHQEIRKNAISLYDKTSLSLIGHLENIKFPINDIDYDPIQNEVILGTGSYDGGCFFEGELLLWNLSNGSTTNLIRDNREIPKCQFIGDQIEFKVYPTDDIMTQDFTIKTYRISRNYSNQQQLENLKPTEINDFENFQNEFNAENEIIELLKQSAFHSNPKSMIWDLVMVKETIYAACSKGIVFIYDLTNETIKYLKLTDKGDCVQVFFNSTTNKVIVNTSFRGANVEDYSIVYEINTTSHEFSKIIQGTFALSKSDENYFLARQTDHENLGKNDVIYDPHFKRIASTSLGNYDLFNHYIRIDETKKLYALIGNPTSSSRNKSIIQINPLNGQIEKKLPLEKQPVHFNNPNFLMTNGRIIYQGKIYNYKPNEIAYKMNCINANGEVLWSQQLNGNAISLLALPKQLCFLCILNTGRIELRDIETGSLIKDITENLKTYNCKPICMYKKDEKIAIGFDSGLIELMKIKNGR